MPNRTPLLFVTAIAIAAAIAFLLKTSGRDNDDAEHDLHLQDDGSDDVTVQVKNGRVSDCQDAACVAGAESDAVVSDVSPEIASAVKATDDQESTDKRPREESEKQKEESIRQEAISKAATIIQSMPAISLVDECIKEVAAAESEATETPTPVEICLDSASKEDLGVSNITTIEEEEVPIEQSVPIKSYPSTPNKKLPKTPPVSLFSPSPAKDDIEPPIDTEDYSKLKDYWIHQSDKNTFSPPRNISAEVVSPVRHPSAETEDRESDVARSTSKEDSAAASAAVAGLMAAGVVNVLDQVYSPKGQVQGQSFENVKDEEVPLMDVSIMDEKTANVEGKEEEGSDEQLILGSSSPSSGSDKSSSDDYVKIVRTPSGDPISESALLSRHVETKGDEKASREETKSSVLEESAAVVTMEDAADVKQETDVEATINEETAAPKEATQQAKKKKKNKKKRIKPKN
jgi:hypothetical protein